LSYVEEEYGYKVDLEVFSGPLDLLLYLIRQEEVEIADIPIARITEQYLAHLELMQQVNVNVAGEFLLMAATLMEIKSRMLLPRPEREGEEEAEDPRADLIRQLIEYKKFKDAARALGARAADQALKFTRGAAATLEAERPAPEELPIDLGELTIWDLLAAFRVILSQTSLDTTRHIVLDERPAVTHCNDLLDELRPRGTATLRELFDPAAGRAALISAFLALLELIRRRRVRVEQAGQHGGIRIVLLDDTPVAESELVVPVEAPPLTAAPPPVQAEPVPAAPPPEPQPLPRPQAVLDEEEVEEFADLQLPDIESIAEPSLDLSDEGAARYAAERAAEAAVGGASVPRGSRARRRGAKPPAPKPCLLRRRRIPSLLARFARCRPVASTRGPVGIVIRKRA